MKNSIKTIFAALSLLVLTGCTPFSFGPVINHDKPETEEDTTLVSSITLNKTIATMKVGESLQLVATVTPTTASNKTVTWSINKTDYATISKDGLVTAKKAGQVTATATANDGSGVKKSCIITISEATSDPVPVTSISLDKTSATLEVGDKVTLTPTINPSNATDKGIVWSTSKDGIVSVSNGVVTATSAGTVTVTATSNNNSKATASCTITVNEKIKPQVDSGSFTLLVYMCGADLESGGSTSSSTASKNGGQASADLYEMISTKNQPDNVNIVVQTGGAKSWATGYYDNSNKFHSYNLGVTISASKTGRYHVKNNKLVLDEQIDKANMGKSSTLQSFLTWGIETYPAEKYGVVLWNHGGAMEGCCFDENYEKSSDYYLTASDVYTAVGNTLTATGMTDEKLEWIGYDCCLMAVQDIAELNSHYFNYMVASQETESGTGWDYDGWLPELYAGKDTTTVLKKIADAFIADNEYDIWGNPSSTASDQTSSVLDLSKMSTYKTAFEALASKLGSAVSSYGKSKFRTLMKTVQSYGNTHMTTQEYNELIQYGYEDYVEGLSYDSTIGYYCDLSNGIERFGTFDVIDFLDKISAESKFSGLSSEISAVRSAFNNLVVHNNASYRAGNSNGLCLVYSYDSYTNYSYKSSETNFNKWFSFNTTYGA